MTLDEVMAHERQGLMAEYLFAQGAAEMQIPPYCAVPDPDIIVRFPSLLRGRHPVQIEYLQGAIAGYSFVQVCPSLAYKFLWVHTENDDYRADYLRFLHQRQRMTLPVLPETHHVDHLYNRARARTMGLTFIRTVLLPKSVNMSHGAGYEKLRTQGRMGKPGRERKLDEVMLMKLWGVMSPRKDMPLSPEMLIHTRHVAVVFGLNPTEVERSIRELMDVATYRPKP